METATQMMGAQFYLAFFVRRKSNESIVGEVASVRPPRISSLKIAVDGLREKLSAKFKRSSN
jgi:hypothetical protein